jgi:hypothetical protein
MSNPEKPTGSDDPDTLAALAADPGRPEADRGSAFEGLHELIRRLAASLSIRLTGTVRPEFVDGAASEIYLRLAGFAPGGPFASWCYRTLHNWMTDELRKESRRQRPEREAASLRPDVQPADPAPQPFSDRELAQVETWPLGQRLALLCLTGLWRVISPPRWRAWYRAYPPSDNPILTDPFPPQEFELCPDPQQRANILAELLQVRRGTLSVWVHRCSPRLRELRGA